MNESPLLLSVIIPAYNEEHRLPVYLASVVEYLVTAFDRQRVEVIVVDDGSTDATAEVAAAMNPDSDMIRVLKIPCNRGKGYAVRAGMLAARGAVRLFSDADGATPIAELPKLQKALDNGADLAVASRALQDNSREVSSRLHRKVIGNIFNLVVRCLAVPGICDTQCGFKLFRGSVAMELFGRQRTDGFGFDVELLFLAHKLGYRSVEVPVNWRDVPGSKVSVMTDAVRMFRDIVVTRIKWLSGGYVRNREGGEA